MGIPSYYRRLKNSVKGLVTRESQERPYGLYFDFNCLVYHILHSGGLAPYTGGEDEAASIAWENTLIDAVLKYVRKIVTIVNPSHEVLICVDGVVPFAKMKQQRLRRFKSAAAAATGISATTSWDRNAITPGTYFMERLGSKLSTLSGGSLHWIVQDASMPGEGEQKIMSYLRSKSDDSDKKIVIYGLDADLIVLSLILSQQCPHYNISLFRENIEFGEMIRNSIGEDTYVYMNINILIGFLKGRLGSGNDVIIQYCMAMCFLGNDFLPHSLGLKISEEGHEVIMKTLQDAIRCGKPLMKGSLGYLGYLWNREGVQYFLETLAAPHREVADIHTALQKKLAHNPKIDGDTTPDFYPAAKVEHDFYGSTVAGKQQQLVPYWRRIYYENYVNRGVSAIISQRAAVKHYFEGLHWIRAYYLGEPVSQTWYYPFFLPPLWSDLLANINKFDTLPEAHTIPTGVTTTQPQEQLALVLPLESWGLIRDKSLRLLPSRIPQYFPSHYEVFSCGKKWMWECEAAIPLLTLQTLRRFVPR